MISSVAPGSVLALRRGVEIFERRPWIGIDGRNSCRTGRSRMITLSIKVGSRSSLYR